MATLMKGTVDLADGTQHEFVSGPRERIKAERYFKIDAKDLQEGKIGEEYVVFLAFESLKRQKVIGAEVTFDEFIDSHLGDYEVEETTGESEAQPEN